MSSQDRVIQFRIPAPTAAPKPAAQLLILVRDGKVIGLLADSPIEATIIDYDSARAQIGVELVEHVPAREFGQIKTAAMDEFLADGPKPAPANDAPQRREFADAS